MKIFALICTPFSVIWATGLMSFFFIFGWQISTYINTGIYPSADMASLALNVDHLIPVLNYVYEIKAVIPSFMHDLHITLILMGIPGLVLVPITFMSSVIQTKQDEDLANLSKMLSENIARNIARMDK